MTRAEVFERLHKLRAVTTANGATEAEAQNANAKARELVEKHGIRGRFPEGWPYSSDDPVTLERRESARQAVNRFYGKLNLVLHTPAGYQSSLAAGFSGIRDNMHDISEFDLRLLKDKIDSVISGMQEWSDELEVDLRRREKRADSH